MPAAPSILTERPDLLALIADCATIDDDAAQDAALALLRMPPARIAEFHSAEALVALQFKGARRNQRRSDERRKARERVRTVSADDVLAAAAELCERDRLILAYTARGMNRRGIAEAMGLSEGCVSSWLSIIRGKIRVKLLGQHSRERIRFSAAP